MKFVLLLRGINVGGKNRVEMARLKKTLESLGYSDVVTYINSGNAIFENDQPPEITQINNALKNTFGFDIPALLLSGEDVIRITKAIPDDWDTDHDKQKSDVLYLFEGVDSPEILDKIGYRPEIEEFIYVKGAVITNISRKNQSKGSLQKIAGTDLYRKITIRNTRTARKLAELVSK